MRHGIGDLQGLFGGFCFFDANSHEFGRAFAVTHDFLGQIGGCVCQRGFKCRVMRMCGAVDVQATLACGNHNERIVGRGVTVNRDAVKRHIGEFFGELIEKGLGDAGVGCQIAQHGRHVGTDHAGALADAGNGDAAVAQTHAL